MRRERGGKCECVAKVSFLTLYVLVRVFISLAKSSNDQIVNQPDASKSPSRDIDRLTTIRYKID